MLYSTLLGGSEDDIVGGMAIDSAGNVYLSGTARGPDFPVSGGAVQPALKGASDTFVVKLNSTGTALMYSTYLGGTGAEQAASIALDSFGNAFVAGTTFSSDFPATATAVQRTLAGPSDAFFYKINSTGTAVLCASYWGGSAADSAADAATDLAGNVYVTGATSSPDFPVKPAAFNQGSTRLQLLRIPISLSRSLTPAVRLFSFQLSSAAPAATMPASSSLTPLMK